MPLYPYRDEKTKKIIEVLRDYDNYDRIPERDEVGDKMTDKEYSEADWKRLIGKGITGVRGPGWRTRKGYH